MWANEIETTDYHIIGGHYLQFSPSCWLLSCCASFFEDFDEVVTPSCAVVFFWNRWKPFDPEMRRRDEMLLLVAPLIWWQQLAKAMMAASDFDEKCILLNNIVFYICWMVDEGKSKADSIEMESSTVTEWRWKANSRLSAGLDEKRFNNSAGESDEWLASDKWRDWRSIIAVWWC